jgi:mRNA-degrading endonuclease RelE of RelBE toxin-antitoxin system
VTCIAWIPRSVGASRVRFARSQRTRNQAGALRKLTVAPESRLRIGDWRALVTLDTHERTINVLRILPRGRA